MQKCPLLYGKGKKTLSTDGGPIQKGLAQHKRVVLILMANKLVEGGYAMTPIESPILVNPCVGYSWEP